VKRVDVVCPGFTSDHLETLEEISMEGMTAFVTSGGKEFNYIPALNDAQAWMTALASIAEKHLQGWPTKSASDAIQLEATATRAKALGASR
jgi:ferrochelatase